MEKPPFLPCCKEATYACLLTYLIFTFTSNSLTKAKRSNSTAGSNSQSSRVLATRNTNHKRNLPNTNSNKSKAHQDKNRRSNQRTNKKRQQDPEPPLSSSDSDSDNDSGQEEEDNEDDEDDDQSNRQDSDSESREETLPFHDSDSLTALQSLNLNGCFKMDPNQDIDNMNEIQLRAHARFLRNNVRLAAAVRQVLPKKMCKNISVTIKEDMWRIHKFVSSPAQQDMFAHMLACFIDPEAHGTRPSHQTETNVQLMNRNMWVDIYSDYALTRLNDTRSYVVAGIRQAAMDAMNKEFAKTGREAHLPGVEQMQRVIRRTFDPDDNRNADDQAVFAWYVAHVLTKVTANATHWGITKYCFKTVSAATFPDNNQKYYIPSNAEAFVLVVWEGYSHVWQEQWRRKRIDPTANISPPRLKKNETASDEQEKMLCHCTDLDIGQRKYGGWKTEYLKKYIAERQTIAVNRLSDWSKKIEGKALETLRNQEGVTEASTPELWELNKKNGKRKATNDAPEEIADLWEVEEV